MSLVNDMLRDLDARQSEEAQVPAGFQTLPLTPRYYGWLIGGGVLVVLLLLGFAVSFWIFRQPRVEASSTPAVVPEITTPVSATVVQPPPPSVPPPRDVAPDVLHPAAGEASNARASASNDAVAQLLVAAENALAEDRLTQPPVNNAYALFSHVLLLQPDNQRAHRGVSQVRARYEQLVDDAVRAQNLLQARQYVQRAEAVGVSGEGLAALRAVVRQAERVAPAAQEESGEAVPEVAKPVAVAQEPASETPDVTIEKSWPSREVEAVAKAHQMLQQGREGDAIATLQAVVADYAQTQSAALLLFDIYVRHGQLDRARQLQARVESQSLKHFLEARLMVEAGQREAALSRLEETNPDGTVTEPWLALQAALYQQTSAPRQAQALYERLVRMDNRQVNYWLGLGVAAEAAGQPEQALRAFTAAYQLRPVNTAVSSYIEQRIDVLSR